MPQSHRSLTDLRANRRALLGGIAGSIAAMPLLGSLPRPVVAAPQEIRPDHPRMLLTADELARLRAKADAGDPAWQALDAIAAELATYSVLQFKDETHSDAPENTIFYTYQGEGWLAAAMPLALAYVVSGEAAYAAQAIALADEMVRAQADPDNQPPDYRTPVQIDNYYPSRSLGPALGFIFDWCYDAIDEGRRGQYVELMNAYFDDIRANGYQRNDHADGNYNNGHLIAIAAMGYASAGDNPRAQEMIDWARMRFDGTPSDLVAPDDIATDNVTQLFEGGYKPAVAQSYNGPAITTAPFLGGIPVQGWAYTSESLARIIDYVLIVRSATGEDLLTATQPWFSQVLRAQQQSLLPNRFMIDPMGDWGGDQGAIVLRMLPLRLAYVLSGTDDGPFAQHFATEWIQESTIPEVSVYPVAEWEEFLFGDPERPSAKLEQPPFYTGFGPVYPAAGENNGAQAYFLMRSDWGPEATWASARMGGTFYNDHQHMDAGSITIARGSDYLLVDAANWKGPAGSIGIVGSSTETDNAASANTLWFNDFGEYQNLWVAGTADAERQAMYAGGQAQYGRDDVIAAELADTHSYVKSDLTSSYNRSGDVDDTAGRQLNFFYRDFAYVRESDVFVVFDQVSVKESTNPLGPYRKHIRWHLPDEPKVDGASATVQHGASRLQIDTLLPDEATLRVVDESTNPDPCDGSDDTCVPYEAWQNASGTFRIEVSGPDEALDLSFLTVLQPGAIDRPAMSTTLFSSDDGAMTGVRIEQGEGGATVVLFNAGPGPAPAPVSSVTYDAGGPTDLNVLCGMEPGAAYAVVVEGTRVTVDRSDDGDQIATDGGVLVLPAG